MEWGQREQCGHNVRSITQCFWNWNFGIYYGTDLGLWNGTKENNMYTM